MSTILEMAVVAISRSHTTMEPWTRLISVEWWATMASTLNSTITVTVQIISQHHHLPRSRPHFIIKVMELVATRTCFKTTVAIDQSSILEFQEIGYSIKVCETTQGVQYDHQTVLYLNWLTLILIRIGRLLLANKCTKKLRRCKKT